MRGFTNLKMDTIIEDGAELGSSFMKRVVTEILF